MAKGVCGRVRGSWCFEAILFQDQIRIREHLRVWNRSEASVIVVARMRLNVIEAGSFSIKPGTVRRMKTGLDKISIRYTRQWANLLLKEWKRGNQLNE